MPLSGNRTPREQPSGRAALDEPGASPAAELLTRAPRVADSAFVRDLDRGARIVTGNAGDHPLVLQLLMQTRQAALAEDFQSRLDEPSYRPSDRLLVRRDSVLLAHVHLANHVAWFEDQRVPIVKFENFAALPEFSPSGYEEELLRTAESLASADGAVLGVVHTDRPDWFAQRGWIPLRGQGHTRANARTVLAHLDAQEFVRRRRRKAAVHIRTWRHFELDHVRQIYDESAPELWGPLYRSEANWQWLIGRKAQDQVLLAVIDREPAGRNGAAPRSVNERVVGYAVVSGSCIVEMMTLPDFARARVQLLARACRDAIDRDHHSISLYTPAADPLHELLVTAGGAWIGDKATPEPRWMLRMLSPERWVERAYPLWRRRARAAGLQRPLEFGLAAPDGLSRFRLTRRSSRLERVGEPPEYSVEGDRSVLASLLLGNLAVSAAIGDGRLRLSHPELAGLLTILFAPRLFWQSPLETMRL